MFTILVCHSKEVSLHYFFLYSYSQHNCKTITYNNFETQQQFFHCRPLCLRAHWVLLSQSGVQKHARSWTTIITNAGKNLRNTSIQNCNQVHCKGPSLFSNIINLDQGLLTFSSAGPRLCYEIWFATHICFSNNILNSNYLNTVYELSILLLLLLLFLKYN
jgi:hypothetical protein